MNLIRDKGGYQMNLSDGQRSQFFDHKTPPKRQDRTQSLSIAAGAGGIKLEESKRAAGMDDFDSLH